MTQYQFSQRERQVQDLETIYLANNPIPKYYFRIRRKLRNGTFWNMTWGEFFKGDPSRGIRTWLDSGTGRSQFAKFIQHISLDTFTSKLPKLRKALTDLSLDLVDTTVFSRHEHILEFALKIYNGNFTDNRDFWRSIYLISLLSQNNLQPPSSSNPPPSSSPPAYTVRPPS